MRRGFTMVELILAVVLVGVMTVYAMLTFNSVSRGWQVSTDYMDKLQRTDFALNQVVSGLRSLYYPHEGSQKDEYGFVLENNGDGTDPDRSDVIEWSKRGTAIIGNKSAVADTVHRIRLMVLEEGNSDYKDRIEVTGLYARHCPDVTLRPKDNRDDIDYSFANDEMYQPVLIADGIVGFNCRVLKDKDSVKKSENDDSLFEDEWESSNSVPYKVELTFMLSDPEGRSYRSNTAPVMRIVRLPLHEQSKDGARVPGSEEEKKKAGPGVPPDGERGTSAAGGNKAGGNANGGKGNTSPGSLSRGGGRGTSAAGGASAGGGGGGAK